MTLAPLAVRYSRVGMAARMRVSSVISSALSRGTLRSARTKTTLSCGCGCGRGVAVRPMPSDWAGRPAMRPALCPEDCVVLYPQLSSCAGDPSAVRGEDTARILTNLEVGLGEVTDGLLGAGGHHAERGSGASTGHAGLDLHACGSQTMTWSQLRAPAAGGDRGAGWGKAHQRRQTWQPSGRQPGQRGARPRPGGPRRWCGQTGRGRRPW